jgi:hypothetical protein
MRPPMRLVLRCAVAGVVLDLTAAVCSSLELLSDQQAIALALPGTLLAVGGLTASAAMTNEAIAHGGFRAGYLLAALVTFCRSTSCRKHGN